MRALRTNCESGRALHSQEGTALSVSQPPQVELMWVHIGVGCQPRPPGRQCATSGTRTSGSTTSTPVGGRPALARWLQAHWFRVPRGRRPWTWTASGTCWWQPSGEPTRRWRRAGARHHPASQPPHLCAAVKTCSRRANSKVPASAPHPLLGARACSGRGRKQRPRRAPVSSPTARPRTGLAKRRARRKPSGQLPSRHQLPRNAWRQVLERYRSIP